MSAFTNWTSSIQRSKVPAVPTVGKPGSRYIEIWMPSTLAGLKAGDWHLGMPVPAVMQDMLAPTAGIQRGMSVPKGIVYVCHEVVMFGLQGAFSILPRVL